MARLSLSMVVGVAVVPSIVHAGNAAEPRVPPSFLGTRCIEVLEPGDPPLHLRIGIPLEETEPTADEPPGTRSFQFFAACREPQPGQDLPPWIDPADVEAAQAANPELGAPDPSLVLPTSPWADCLIPLTAFDERMPIDCDATAHGVDVSTDALAPGNYVVYGYTYEPDKNLWTARDGVVRVLGDAGEDGLPPAVTLTYPLSDAVASTGTGVVVTGCAAGLAGTMVELSWASVGDLAAFGDDAWVPFETTEITEITEITGDDSSFSVPFVPPADAEYSVVRIRARAIDPQGRAWVSYSRPPLVLEPGCADPEGGLGSTSDLCGVGPAMAPASPPEAARDECVDDDEGDESGGDADGGSTDDGGLAETTGTDGDPEVVEEAVDEASGGCRVGGPGSGWRVGLLLLALIRWRRATPRPRPSANRPR